MATELVAVPGSIALELEKCEYITVKGQLTSSLVFSAIILVIPIPTPSITANRHAHPIAEFLAAFIPPRTASAPPVKNPAITTQTHGQPSFPLNQSHLSRSSSLPFLKPPPLLLSSIRTNSLALYGSSFFLSPFTAQSNVLNSPPQTPKLPPRTGARAFIAVRAPMRRSP